MEVREGAQVSIRRVCMCSLQREQCITGHKLVQMYVYMPCTKDGKQKSYGRHGQGASWGSELIGLSISLCLHVLTCLSIIVRVYVIQARLP